MNTNPIPVGLIGLGLLGGAIGERLLQNGIPVLGYDLDLRRKEEFASIGGKVAPHAAEVLSSCHVLVLSLPTSDVVSALVTEWESLFREGRILIDTTTGHPAQMTDIERRLKQKGVNYIEATVAGSSQQMRSGRAILFIGGDAVVVESVQPLLNALSFKSFNIGPVGAASRFKLVHNLILGLHRAVLAEGLGFAESLGFTPLHALEVLKQTPAFSEVMKTKGEKMATRDWTPEARLSQHLKDVRLILELAKASHTPTPLSLAHRELLELAVQLGYGEVDNSAILEAFRSESR